MSYILTTRAAAVVKQCFVMFGFLWIALVHFSWFIFHIYVTKHLLLMCQLIFKYYRYGAKISMLSEGLLHQLFSPLIHLARLTHICVSKLTIIYSDNGLSYGRHQAIIWINAKILLIGYLGTKFGEIVDKIHKSSFKKMHMKMSSGKFRP